MNDIQFINGLMFKAPHERAPDFVKAKGSIKRTELIETLQGMEGEWVNFDVKESRAGKWYCSVDNWEPTKDQEYKEGMSQAKAAAEPAGGDFDQDIPFAPYMKGEW